MTCSGRLSTLLLVMRVAPFSVKVVSSAASVKLAVLAWVLVLLSKPDLCNAPAGR